MQDRQKAILTLDTADITSRAFSTLARPHLHACPCRALASSAHVLALALVLVGQLRSISNNSSFAPDPRSKPQISIFILWQSPS